MILELHRYSLSSFSSVLVCSFQERDLHSWSTLLQMISNFQHILMKELTFCISLSEFVKLAEIFASAGSNFQDSFEKLLPRPWVLDDLDHFKQRWLRKPWKRVCTLDLKNYKMLSSLCAVGVGFYSTSN